MKLKENIDNSIKPGNDFYAYANGSWMKNNAIPDDQARWGTFDILAETNIKKTRDLIEGLSDNADTNSEHQKLRDFYISALDDQDKAEQNGLNMLKSMFVQIENVKNHNDLITLIGKFNLSQLANIWHTYLEPDERNSVEYIVRLEQDGLGLPDRDYYLKDDPALKKIREKYFEHIKNGFALLNENIPNCAETILRIETELANFSMTNVQRRDVEATYNKFSSKDLCAKYGNINWQDFFKELEILLPENLIVNEPDFFEHLNKLLVSISITEWQTYLKWHLFLSLSGTFGERFDQFQFEFYGKILNGLDKIKPRWKRAISIVDSCIGDISGKLFVEKHFPPVAKQKMEQLVLNVKSAFVERLLALDWMEDQSKKYALQKLNKMILKIGYPDKWIDYSALEISADNYAQNYINAGIFDTRRHLAKLGKPIDRSEWFMNAHTVNAYANFNMNEIVFPAGILQSPFFDFDADDSLNYGGIGTVIAHEITHGFDDIGSKFGDDGNLKNWRTESDKNNFDLKTLDMVSQADNFFVMDNLYLNGKLTLGENIADLGGVEIAFTALQKVLSNENLNVLIEDFTPAQRFFLNYALTEACNYRDEYLRNQVLTNPHSPSKFRVNGPLSNCSAFYDAFKVEAADLLYLDPEKRIKIW